MKKILNKILYPPGWLILIFAVASAAGLVAVFWEKKSENILAYVIYTFSAYALTVTVLFFVKPLPKQIKTVKQKVCENPYGNKYFTDISYRVTASLFFTFAVNVVYSAFKLVSGVVYSSVWLVSVAVYYVILAVLRFLLLRYMRKARTEQDKIEEFRKYRQCGILMLFLNLALETIVTYVLNNPSPEQPHQIIVIASAVYTFYTVTVSTVDVFKYRTHESPIVSAAKSVRLAAAGVAVLSLTTSMLARFGTDEVSRNQIILWTGSAIGGALTAMSVYMIIRGTREIRKLHRQSKNAQE